MSVSQACRSAISCSTVLNSPMISPLIGCRSASGGSASRPSSIRAYSARRSAGSSGMMRGVSGGLLEDQAVVRGQQLADVEEDQQPLAAADDAAQERGVQPAEQLRRRRDLRALDRRDLDHLVDRGGNPLTGGGEHENARVVVRLLVLHLEPEPEIDHRQHARLVLDHAFDPLGHIRDRRRHLVSQHALDGEDVRREQIVAEAKGDDLDGGCGSGWAHAGSGTGSTASVCVSISTSSSAISMSPRHATPSSTPSGSVPVGTSRSSSSSSAITSSTSSTASASLRPSERTTSSALASCSRRTPSADSGEYT